MKQRFKQLLSIALVTCALTAHAQDTDDRNNSAFGKPYFQARSQGQNLARRLVGDAHELYRCDFDCINGVLAIIPQWSQTFDRHQLGDYFSFRNPTAVEANFMSFRGSLVPGATAANTDVRAENFLLPSNFDGIVELRPNVKNFIADINFRLNLDEWLCGLYFEVDIPVNWTRWSMGLEERVIAAGTNFSIPASNPPADNIAPFTWPTPIHTIIEAWTGTFNGQVNFTSVAQPAAVPPLAASPLPNPIQITIEEMQFARIRGHKSKTGVADLEFVLGYNFFCNDCYHLGANLRVTAPTVTRPDAEFMFEPIVGNGHHVKLGGGLNGHAILWENGCDQSFSLWFDSAFYHEFNARQKRTFDLIGNGIGSRYLLYKRFTPGAAPNTFEFANTFVPGPNVNTVDSKVKINVSGEAILMFDYQRCGFTFDAGYGIWGRSKEEITIVGEIPPNTFGLLGGTPIDNNVPGAANRTNSQVRINGAGATADGDAVQVFTTVDRLDKESAEAPSALSHKVFAHLGYTWEGCDYSPFFGFGGEAEFSGKHNRALDQWSVWVKTGFAFS